MVNQEFISLIRDIATSEEFRSMKKCKHHIKGSVYDHSLKVAYLCYKHHKRFGMKIGIGELVRGALLHDYYLYNLHEEGTRHRLHWFRHPRHALCNALKRYPDLTKKQQDMIRHHMFPVTPMPPMTAAGWIVCFYDKVAAVSDCRGRNKWEPFEASLARNRKKELVYNIS